MDSPARQYSVLWDAAESADLEQFLSRCPGLERSELASVLRVDQRERWRRGERVPAEDYLRRHPDLDAERELDLVYAEFLLREDAGETPSVEEYARRFPRLAEALRKQIELHQALILSDRLTVRESETPSAVPLPHLPGYEVIGRLGRGGMGVVFRARQKSLNRDVAVKVLSDLAADEEQRTRFRAEAEAMARLRHPNIVQVYDVAEHAGRPFFAMELIEGRSLDKVLAGRRLSASEAGRLVETLARAVESAHPRGVLHRDLKPGNVLLDIEGQPHVTDFGLAKRLDGALDQTPTGAVLGTPAYMAPEQALGQTRTVGPAADVYALGAILYECLTGRPPFQGRTLLDTLDQVRHRRPTPLRRIVAGVPAELEAVCLRCLQKDPNRRFLTAADLAEALASLNSPTTLPPRRTRGALYTLTACLVLSTGALLWAVSRPPAEPAPEPTPGPSAVAPADPELWGHHPAELVAVLGDEHFRPWSEVRAVACGGRWIATGCDDGTVRLWNARSGFEAALVRPVSNVRGPVSAVAISGDSRWLAARWFGDAGGDVVRVWDIADGKMNHVGDWPVPVALTQIAFRPDSKALVTGTHEGNLLVSDLTRPGTKFGDLVKEAHQDGVRGLTFLADGRLASVGGDGTIKLWMADGDRLTIAENLRGEPNTTAAVLAADGRAAVTVDPQHGARLWSVAEGILRSPVKLTGHVGTVHAAAFLAGGGVVTAGTDGTLRLHDPTSSPVIGNQGPVRSLAFSPDGRRLATADHAGTCIWNLSARSPRLEHRFTIRDGDTPPTSPRWAGVAWAADDAVVAMEVLGEPIQFWRPQGEPKSLASLRLPRDEGVSGLTMSPDGRTVAVSLFSEGIRLIDVSDGRPKPGASLAVAGEVHLPALAGPEREGMAPRLVAVENDSVVKMWRLPRDREPESLPPIPHGRKAGVCALAVRGGDRLALGFNDGVVQLWELGQEPRLLRTIPAEPLKGYRTNLSGLAIAADGRVAVSDEDGRVVVRNEEGDVVVRWQLGGAVHAVAFSPDGKRLATANGNGTAYLLELPEH